MNHLHKRTYRFSWTQVISISFAHFVHDVFSSFLAPILPLLIDKFGLSLTSSGLLTLVQRIPSFMNFLIGAFAHLLPWRMVVVFTPLFTAIAGSLLGAAPNLLTLILLLFGIGVNSALFHVTSPVLINHYSGNKTGLGMSIYMLGGEGARFAGPLLVVWGVSMFGLEGIYRLMLMAMLITILLAFLIGPSPEKKHREQALNEAWQKALRSNLPFFAVLSVFMLSRALMRSSLSTFLPTYYSLEGASLWEGAFGLSIFQLSGAVGVLTSGIISDRIGRLTTLKWAAIISPILMLLFTWLPEPYDFLTLLLLGFFVMSTTPVLLAMVQEQKTHRPIFLNGIFMSINFGVGAISVVISGIMGDWIGLEQTFRWAAFFSLLAIPSLFFLNRVIKS